jgi:hypothetical protein
MTVLAKMCYIVKTKQKYVCIRTLNVVLLCAFYDRIPFLCFISLSVILFLDTYFLLSPQGADHPPPVSDPLLHLVLRLALLLRRHLLHPQPLRRQISQLHPLWRHRTRRLPPGLRRPRQGWQ